MMHVVCTFTNLQNAFLPNMIEIIKKYKIVTNIRVVLIFTFRQQLSFYSFRDENAFPADETCATQVACVWICLWKTVVALTLSKQ